MHLSSIWPIDRILSGATTQGQSGLGSDGNEGVLRIPQSFIITRTSRSDSLVLYPGHSLKEVFWGAVGVFYSLGRLGKLFLLERLQQYIMDNRMVAWLVGWCFVRYFWWLLVKLLQSPFFDSTKNIFTIILNR